MVVNSGIRKVVVSGDYADKDGLKILEAAGVEVINLNGDKDED